MLSTWQNLSFSRNRSKVILEGFSKDYLFFQVAPPDTVQELLTQVTASSSRNYFMGVFFAVIGVIFFGGLMCGRVTKRVRAEMKNR